MDPINPWLDPSEVRQLAEKLIRPVEESQVVSKSPSFDTSFVGFLDSDEPAEHPAAPQPAAQPQIPAATFSPPPSIPAPSIPAIPTTPQPEVKVQALVKAAPTTQAITTLLDGRFLNFRNWLSQHFDAKEIFILDHTGSVIYDESHHGRLHFIARDLILQSDQPHNVRVNFGPAANLELIPCDSPQGLLMLGAIFPISLHIDQVANIHGALSQSLAS